MPVCNFPVLGYGSTPTGFLYQFATFSQQISDYVACELQNLAAWETSARSAGVAEANIIAVLQSWNTWEAAMGDLQNTVDALSPNAQINVADYRATRPPTLPSINNMITAQGGALTGAAQYAAPVSVTTPPPPVSVPPVVAANPSPTLAGALANQGTPVGTTSAVPSGEAGGAYSPSASPGVGGFLPPAPSGPVGDAMVSVSPGNDVAILPNAELVLLGDAKNGAAKAAGFAFLPAVPKWLVLLAVGSVLFILLRPKRGR